jgi:hypothetical protein
MFLSQIPSIIPPNLPVSQSISYIPISLSGFPCTPLHHPRISNPRYLSIVYESAYIGRIPFYLVRIYLYLSRISTFLVYSWMCLKFPFISLDLPVMKLINFPLHSLHLVLSPSVSPGSFIDLSSHISLYLGQVSLYLSQTLLVLPN